MEEFLRSELGIEDLKCLGKGGSGCISEGMTYQTDKGEKLFIKFNNKPGVYKNNFIMWNKSITRFIKVMNAVLSSKETSRYMYILRVLKHPTMIDVLYKMLMCWYTDVIFIFYYYYIHVHITIVG